MRDRLVLIPLLAGAVLLLAVLFIAMLTSAVFLPAYLVALLFWLGLPLGALGWLGIWHLTGGRWGSREVVAALRLLVLGLPLMALLFVPLVIFPGHLYGWAGGEAGHGEGFRDHYIATPWFIVRTVVYFAVWLVLAMMVGRATPSRDMPRGEPNARVGSVTVIVYTLTMSLAAIDWGMSLSGEWISTIYGLLFVVGQALAALCAAILLVTRPVLQQRAVLDPDVLHDLGKFLLAAVAMWAYVNFSQLLIYYAGNLPVEISWYVVRLRGFWGGVFVLLVFAHFFIPLFALLSAAAKRSARFMSTAALCMLVVHLIDIEWRVAPAFERETLWPVLLDLMATAAVGGLFFAMMRWYEGRSEHPSSPAAGVPPEHGQGVAP